MITKTKILLLINTIIILCISGCEDAKLISGYRDGEEMEEGESAPFVLDQNYPNPFNGSTTIPFRVAVSLDLKLTVFSEEWQPVTVLFDQRPNPGFHQTNFNAGGLPNGDYFYMLEGGGYKQIRKMKLIK